MPKLLVCQHVPYEPLGTLDSKLRASGVRIRYVNFGRDPNARPSLEGYAGLVILGGPMNVDEVECHPHLATEVELIRDAIARQIPVLGICLGAQLIAKALGARVRAAAKKEIGWTAVSLTREGQEDPLLRHLAALQPLFQWHGDEFELPGGAVHLASSELCACQAFRVGGNVYGFQFHLEVDQPLVERWLEVLGGEVDPVAVRAETRERIAGMQAIADCTFGEFIRLIGAKPRRVRILPSR